MFFDITFLNQFNITLGHTLTYNGLLSQIVTWMDSYLIGTRAPSFYIFDNRSIFISVSDHFVFRILLEALRSVRLFVSVYVDEVL